MKNEIRIRKKRFLAAMVMLLLLLNQLPPIPAQSTEYAAETLYSNQILNPGDIISNGSGGSCAITYYDYGETGGELSSDSIGQDSVHTVPAYTGTLPAGFRFTGWQVLYVSIASGDVVESITLEAVVAINGTEIGDSLFGVTLNAGTVIYSSTDTYTITYYDQDGETTVIEAAQISANTPYTVAGYPGTVPTGYRFAGWNVSYVWASGGSGAIELTAQLTTNQFTITFNTDGGSTVDAITAGYGAAITAPADPTREGYTFAGWDKTIPATMPAENITITAQWTANQYTIRFVNEDGSELQSSEMAYGETPAYTGETPTKAATAQYTYTFAGWDAEIVPVAGNVTYTATYTGTVNKYTVKFQNEDGSELQSSEMAYGETPAYTGETPTKAATAQYTYTFDGWDAEIVPVAGNVTYTATYTGTVNKYTVKFQNEDGSELQSSEVAYGETPAYNGETPTKAATTEHSYTFAGWTPEITAVTGDATYTATYTETADQYTITFDTDGGSAIAPITQDYGTAVTAPADPTRTGYTFAGWDKTIPTTMPAENVTITARWTVNRYTITFDTNGGSKVNSITQDYGTAVTAPADPTRTGYTFAGWDETIPTTMPAENITITAWWTVKSYNIRYILNGGTNRGNPGFYTYGIGIPSFANAAKPGYSFAGWYTSANFSGNKITSVAANRTGDITLYAKFVMEPLEAGTYYLEQGVQYQLGSGVQLSGDSCVYGSGILFYVPVSGYYTFE